MKTLEKYSALRIALHWLMVLPVVGVYATINLSDAFPKGSSARDGRKTWHFMLGLSVLALGAEAVLGVKSGSCPYKLGMVSYSIHSISSAADATSPPSACTPTGGSASHGSTKVRRARR